MNFMMTLQPIQLHKTMASVAADRVCGEFKLTLPPGFARGLCSAVASDMSRGMP